MPAELIAAGLATRSRTGHLVDLFRDRIMFPVHHPDGHPVAFLGRAAPSANADAPKYLNTPDTAIYHKGQILYGAGEQADRVAAGATPILVEGPVDVLAVALAFPAGDRVGIATCGTGLTTHHAAAIAAMPGAAGHGVTAALDNDDAGRKATERAWQLLTGHRAIGLFAATLPDHTDPGDLITSTSDIADLRAALTTHARPLAKAVIDNRLDELATRRPDLLRWIEGRVIAARALVGLIVHLPADQIVALTGYIASRTQTTFDTVAEAVITNLERPPAGHHIGAHGTPLSAHTTPMWPTAFPPPDTPSTKPAEHLHAVTGCHAPRRTR